MGTSPQATTTQAHIEAQKQSSEVATTQGHVSHESRGQITESSGGIPLEQEVVNNQSGNNHYRRRSGTMSEQLRVHTAPSGQNHVEGRSHSRLQTLHPLEVSQDSSSLNLHHHNCGHRRLATEGESSAQDSPTPAADFVEPQITRHRNLSIPTCSPISSSAEYEIACVAVPPTPRIPGASRHLTISSDSPMAPMGTAPEVPTTTRTTPQRLTLAQGIPHTPEGFVVPRAQSQRVTTTPELTSVPRILRERKPGLLFREPFEYDETYRFHSNRSAPLESTQFQEYSDANTPLATLTLPPGTGLNTKATPHERPPPPTPSARYIEPPSSRRHSTLTGTKGRTAFGFDFAIPEDTPVQLEPFPQPSAQSHGGHGQVSNEMTPAPIMPPKIERRRSGTVLIPPLEIASTPTTESHHSSHCVKTFQSPTVTQSARMASPLQPIQEMNLKRADSEPDPSSEDLMTFREKSETRVIWNKKKPPGLQLSTEGLWIDTDLANANNDQSLIVAKEYHVRVRPTQTNDHHHPNELRIGDGEDNCEEISEAASFDASSEDGEGMRDYIEDPDSDSLVSVTSTTHTSSVIPEGSSNRSVTVTTDLQQTFELKTGRVGGQKAFADWSELQTHIMGDGGGIKFALKNGFPQPSQRAQQWTGVQTKSKAAQLDAPTTESAKMGDDAACDSIEVSSNVAMTHPTANDRLLTYIQKHEFANKQGTNPPWLSLARAGPEAHTREQQAGDAPSPSAVMTAESLTNPSQLDIEPHGAEAPQMGSSGDQSTSQVKVIKIPKPVQATVQNGTAPKSYQTVGLIARDANTIITTLLHNHVIHKKEVSSRDIDGFGIALTPIMEGSFTHRGRYKRRAQSLTGSDSAASAPTPQNPNGHKAHRTHRSTKDANLSTLASLSTQRGSNTMDPSATLDPGIPTRKWLGHLPTEVAEEFWNLANPFPFYSYSLRQGPRKTMQDTFALVPSFRVTQSMPTHGENPEGNVEGLFALCDGHGRAGGLVAELVAELLRKAASRANEGVPCPWGEECEERDGKDNEQLSPSSATCCAPEQSSATNATRPLKPSTSLAPEMKPPQEAASRPITIPRAKPCQEFPADEQKGPAVQHERVLHNPCLSVTSTSLDIGESNILSNRFEWDVPRQESDAPVNRMSSQPISISGATKPFNYNMPLKGQDLEGQQTTQSRQARPGDLDEEEDDDSDDEDEDIDDADDTDDLGDYQDEDFLFGDTHVQGLFKSKVRPVVSIHNAASQRSQTSQPISTLNQGITQPVAVPRPETLLQPVGRRDIAITGTSGEHGMPTADQQALKHIEMLQEAAASIGLARSVGTPLLEMHPLVLNISGVLDRARKARPDYVSVLNSKEYAQLDVSDRIVRRQFKALFRSMQNEARELLRKAATMESKNSKGTQQRDAEGEMMRLKAIGLRPSLTNLAGFSAMHEILDQDKPPEYCAGGAAVTVVRVSSRERKVWVASVGDVRAFVVRRGTPVELTVDDYPDRPDEQRRISKLGGHIFNVGGQARLAGELGVSRAIGDANYEPYVSWEPTVTRLDIQPGDFLFICTDGLFQKITVEEICEHVVTERRERLKRVGTCGCAIPRIGPEVWRLLIDHDRKLREREASMISERDPNSEVSADMSSPSCCSDGDLSHHTRAYLDRVPPSPLNSRSIEEEVKQTAREFLASAKDASTTFQRRSCCILTGARGITEEALRRGARDNVSCMIVDLDLYLRYINHSACIQSPIRETDESISHTSHESAQPDPPK